MANENLKKQMVVKLGTTTNTEAQLISNMVDGALSGKGGNDPELENLKKQMVIKLGTTTNEDAQIISNMVDNAAGSGGSVPSCDVTLVHTGSGTFELNTDAYSGMLALNAYNIIEDYIFYSIEPNESLTLKFGLINGTALSPEERVNMVGMGDYLERISFDTEDYSSVYTNLNNVNILVERNPPLTPGAPDKYYYQPVVIDITKPASCTLTMDFNNL